MSENGAKPSVQALDAFSEWMRRVDEQLSSLSARIDNVNRMGGAREHITRERLNKLEAHRDTVTEHIVDRKLVARIEALEAKLPDNTLNPKHWRVEPDGTFDATVQLRRDVGTLVRAAREVIAEIDRDEGVRAARVSALRAAVNIFAGDYT